MIKSVVDLDLRWTIPILSGLAFVAAGFVVGNPPPLAFDHLMPADWIPSALALSKVLVFVGPGLATTHSLAASYSPRVEPPKA